jgi:acyl dehydratase
MFYQVMPHVDDETHGVNYGFDKLRFLAPVPSGSRIRGQFTLAKADIDTVGQVTFHTDVTVQIDGHDKPALAARWINRSYYKAPS